jgi:tRNA pseudouridine55 synthase
MITKNKIINGIFLLDKPLHLSSNGALQRVKRLFGAKKAGHTGSLDPLATGMLPICFGEATKFSQFLLDSDKYYSVVAKFGEKTSTGDSEGEVIETSSFDHVTVELFQQTLTKFLGVTQQIPPMFSALKHKGKPLYELARQGIEIDRPAREIEIFSMTGSVNVTHFSLAVHCSKGTYIRTLVEDIAAAMNSCAHVVELRRTKVTP